MTTIEPDTTIMKLDEAALRRPDFIGGNPILLCDNQEWYFPRPCLEMTPMFGEGDRFFVGVSTTLGTAFDDLVVSLDGNPETGEESIGFGYIDAMMRVAVWMLRRNYTLSNQDLSTLLKLRTEDDENDAMWKSIMCTAKGVSEKKPGAAIAS